jgi:MtN3 and saliva related transmembrane protein
LCSPDDWQLTGVPFGDVSTTAKLLELWKPVRGRQEWSWVMTTQSWVTVVGTVGGFCTTFAFVPQLVKIWKQGGRDLSYGMLTLYLIGVSMWFVYGLLLHALAIILTNGFTGLLIAFATVLKAWTGNRIANEQTLRGEPAE